MAFVDFDTHFGNIYEGRWPGLLVSLRQPELQVARLNRFVGDNRGSESCNYLGIDGCQAWFGGEVPRAENNLLFCYIMDPASVLAARALQVQDGDVVLDMCAAPGGKTLILSEALRESGELIANEISAGRRERLKKVIQQYIPRDVRDRVWVSGKDAGLFAVQAKQKFDRILLDAPCSGERHLLENAKELEAWSLSRSKKLAQRQYALLTAALEAVKPGGRIVYSTCSISPLENDAVIERVLEKKQGRLKVCQSHPQVMGEVTKHGTIYLPDKCGFGPLYFCTLERLG